MITKAQSILVSRLSRQVDVLQAELEEWKTSFSQDPVYALEWADSVFENTADLLVHKIILQALEVEKFDDDTTGKALSEWITTTFRRDHERAVEDACRVGGSTSNSSNAMDRAKAKAWVSMFNRYRVS